jgi:hypothetical protein
MNTVKYIEKSWEQTKQSLYAYFEAYASSEVVAGDHLLVKGEADRPASAESEARRASHAEDIVELISNCNVRLFQFSCCILRTEISLASVAFADETLTSSQGLVFLPSTSNHSSLLHCAFSEHSKL